MARTMGWHRRTIAATAAALVASLGWSHPAAAQSNRTTPANISARIGSVLDNLPDPKVQCGALIVDLQTGKTVYAHDADRRLTPASNQKLVVLAAAIDHFPESTAFETVIGQLGDTLVIVGDGDPALGDPEVAADQGVAPLAFLDLWAHALQAGGHANTPGGLVVDATIFDDEYIHPEWDAEDLVRWYGAPIGGLNLYNNCVEVTVWPRADAGQPANYALNPPTPIFKIENRCRTVAPGQPNSPAVGRVPGSWEIVLSGKVRERVTLQAISAAEPNAFAATAIAQHLTDAGLRLGGQIRYARVRRSDGSLPPDLQVLAAHRTPIAYVLGRIGGDSQNMCAESLFKRLGYERMQQRGEFPAVGSWSSGREAVSGFLHSVGCDLNTISIVDGSGLSRSNQANATEFVKILEYMHTHERRELFLSSLAGNRTGGTLAGRMRSVDGDVYAKTGYMSGVRALSGYVRTRDDKWYAFSVIFNGFKGSSRPYNDKLRELCRILADAP